MLINCNSCQKKFVVPDNAITDSGRLVQCGSCGSKWTQYPIDNLKLIKDHESKKKTASKKPFIKKTKNKKNLFTAEYLKKKYGLTIDEPAKNINKNLYNNKNNRNTLGFYSYVFILLVFLLTLFGVLNLSKKIIILKYPPLEPYIGYLYEIIEIVKVFFFEFFN